MAQAETVRQLSLAFLNRGLLGKLPQIRSLWQALIQAKSTCIEPQAICNLFSLSEIQLYEPHKSMSRDAGIITHIRVTTPNWKAFNWLRAGFVSP